MLLLFCTVLSILSVGLSQKECITTENWQYSGYSYTIMLNTCQTTPQITGCTLSCLPITTRLYPTICRTGFSFDTCSLSICAVINSLGQAKPTSISATVNYCSSLIPNQSTTTPSNSGTSSSTSNVDTPSSNLWNQIQYIAIYFAIGFAGLCVLMILYCYLKRCLTRMGHHNNQTKPQGPIQVNLSQYCLDNQGPCQIPTAQACAICLDDFTNLRTHCGHYYHVNCFQTWIKKKQTPSCPLCMQTQFNPVKTYCEACKAGISLHNISIAQSINQLQMCSTCKAKGTIRLSQKVQKDDRLCRPVRNLSKVQSRRNSSIVMPEQAQQQQSSQPVQDNQVLTVVTGIDSLQSQSNVVNNNGNQQQSKIDKPNISTNNSINQPRLPPIHISPRIKHKPSQRVPASYIQPAQLTQCNLDPNTNRQLNGDNEQL